LLGLIVEWAEYLRGNDEPQTQTTLLRGIRTGRPAGSEQFVEMIERLTGRDLAMRKAGRPLKRVS
jgi:putative transposase